MVTSAYTVEEVLGSRPGHVILKISKIVVTAALFSVEHIRVRVWTIIHNLLTLEPPGHGLRSQLGWLSLGIEIIIWEKER